MLLGYDLVTLIAIVTAHMLWAVRVLRSCGVNLITSGHPRYRDTFRKRLHEGSVDVCEEL